MRTRFIQENSLDALPISEVVIDDKSRHKFAALLAGLQYIFVTPEWNEKIYLILETKIMADKKATGRWGLTLWEILVLGSTRLCLNISYDGLEDLANNHATLRGILGVKTKEIFEKEHQYYVSTLKENVGMLDDATLKEINKVIVKAGHEVLKKNEKLELEEEKIVLRIKSDTFPVAANVHFPTDMNLLWDSLRKSLDTMLLLLEIKKTKGWRKIVYIKTQLKKYYRTTSEIHRKKGNDYKTRLVAAATTYLSESKKISLRIKATIQEYVVAAQTDKKLFGLLKELKKFVSMLDKHVNLLERRVLNDEQIPHSEKLFSIFEEHVEWLAKGKLYNAITIGHNVLITSDQYHFIIDFHVAENEVDKKLAIPMAKRVAETYSEGYYLKSSSLDRGFYSGAAKKFFQKIFVQVIMPKYGKKSAKIEQEENEASYVSLRKKHSAVESNINELQHGGIDFVPDKSLEGFKEYVGLGVVAHNLKRLGKILIAQKKAKEKAASNRQKAAA